MTSLGWEQPSSALEQLQLLLWPFSCPPPALIAALQGYNAHDSLIHRVQFSLQEKGKKVGPILHYLGDKGVLCVLGLWAILLPS